MPEFLEVTERSPLLTESSDCIYCHSDLLLKDQVVICDYCSSPHHLDCWEANNNRCATFGCTGGGRGISRSTTASPAATTQPHRPAQQARATNSGRSHTWIWHRIFLIAVLISLSIYVVSNEMGSSQDKLFDLSPFTSASTTLFASPTIQAELQQNDLGRNSPLEAPAQNSSFFSFSACSQTIDIDVNDCVVLVTLYDKTNGPSWKNQRGWRSSNEPCDWYGITCKNDRVSRIQLPRNQLVGEIPPEIVQLSRLETLTMSGNQLNGEIPSELGFLFGLRQIFLDDNRLTGEIPSEWGNLPHLLALDLANNQLSGEIPAGLSSTTAIKRLDLSNNQLSGVVSEELACALARFTVYNISGIEYNQLSAATEEAATCLSSVQKDWATTQTVAPTNVEVMILSEIAVQVKWTPILYTQNDGYYEVGRSDDGGETFTVVGQTNSKLSAELILINRPEDDSGSEYLYAVRTFTSTHDDQQSALTSAYSLPARALPQSE